MTGGIPGSNLANVPPAVSILLPVYNAAGTLPLCLASIRRQAFSDWQCVVVDDGSSDGSANLAEDVAATDPRFSVVRRRRAGIVESLDAGIERCGGEFVARMDADDWMHRERLALQLRAFADDPALDLVGTHVRSFPRDGLQEGFREYEQWLNSMNTPQDLLRERYIECPLAHPTWMVRRSALASLRYRDRGWPEDYDFLLRLLDRGLRAGVVRRRLVGWRHHSSRLSQRDPRYSLESFTACRASFLASGYLSSGDAYLLWGYGQTGRALRRALADHGKRMAGLIEVHEGRLGQKIHGAPVVAPGGIDALPGLPLIVSVSGARPRNEIRAKLKQLNRVEGRDFVCAA